MYSLNYANYYKNASEDSYCIITEYSFMCFLTDLTVLIKLKFINKLA